MPRTPSTRAPAGLVTVVLATGLATVGALAGTARADTVILTDGKKLEGVVVSRNDDTGVWINPWNSRYAEMTWEIPEKCHIPRDKVKEVIEEDAPLVEARRRAMEPGIPADRRKELIAYCRRHKLDEEAKVQERLLLGQDLAQQKDDTGATQAIPAAAKGDPEVDPELRQLEREYLALKDPAALDAQWKMMQERSTARPRVWLERARRSAQQPKGRRDKVALTVRAKEAPGGNYCIYVPAKYDPLVPTPLVVALHGGGAGGKDAKLVTGNGQEAMNFYQDLAEQWGWVVVCPSALVAGWGSKENEPLVDGVVEELRMLFNVDEARIYLTGHSMGGWGTWEWAPKRPDLWAACAPCAGGGGPNGVDPALLPTYIYHGTDDQICRVEPDRDAANNFAKAKKADFVYTEIDKVGHGFPDWVRQDIFKFFAGRMKTGKKRAVEPVPSFARKVDKAEALCFGDPAAAPSAEGDGADAKLKELVAKLERGGGSAIEASAELSKRKDAATAKAVGNVLRSKKANPDVRVAAAKALGDIGGPEAAKALAAEVANEDFRIVDEVVSSLGKLGGAAVLEPLLKASKTMAGFFDAAFQGTQIGFTEFEVRCQSFGRLCDALATTGQADACAAALEKDVVVRVYTPKTAYQIPIDDRFVHIPPRARLELVQHLRTSLVALKAAHGKQILTAIRAAWGKEAPLAAECDAGIAELP